MNETYNQPTEAILEQQSDSIEHLRRILELKLGRDVSRDEAEEVGDSLITFYEILAGAS